VGFEGDRVAHHVIASLGELMRHRLDRHQAIGLGFLALVERLDFRVIPDCEIGCLDKCPGQVSIPVLDVTGAFLLTPSLTFRK
jgi:hypothetical protein